MKKVSVRLFVFFVVVFTISGIHAENYTTTISPVSSTSIASTITEKPVNSSSNVCKKAEEECETDDDCCNKNCRRSILLVRKYCKMPVMKYLRNALPLFPKDKLVMCVYSVEQNPVLENVMRTNLGPNVGSRYLDPDTRVIVTVNGTEVEAKVNERGSNGSDILMLSEFAAKNLGLVQPGSFECELYVPFWVNHSFIRRTMYMIPIIGVLYILVQFDLLA